MLRFNPMFPAILLTVLFLLGEGECDLAAQACYVPNGQYYVQYRAYIPADHLVTAVPCWIGQRLASPVPVSYGEVPAGLIMIMGDASSFSTKARIWEGVNLLTRSGGAMPQNAVQKGQSVSYNFESPSSPINTNISQGDFNPQALLRCWHEQATGQADMSGVTGSATSTAANQASVSFSGAASDPLFTNPVAPIQFNLNVAINASANTATITGSHTCFPAHQIMIGSQVVYDRKPSPVNFAELSYCLIGSPYTDTQVNCTVPLDGVSKCP